MEGQLLLAVLAQRFRMRKLAPHQHIEPESALVLRPHNGLFVQLELA